MTKRRRSKRKMRLRIWSILLFVLGVGLVCALLCPLILPPEVSAAFRRGTAGASAPPASRNVSEPVPEAGASVRWDDGFATVTGRGRIAEDSAQGRALARRAALTDARRNFLVLRGRLSKGDAQRGRTVVSGTVRTLRVHSERVEGSFYLAELDVPLDDLQKQGYLESLEF